MKKTTPPGFMLANEQRIIENMSTASNKYFVPLVWSSSLVLRARKEGRIKDDFAVKTLIDVCGGRSFRILIIGVGDQKNKGWSGGFLRKVCGYLGEFWVDGSVYFCELYFLSVISLLPPSHHTTLPSLHYVTTHYFYTTPDQTAPHHTTAPHHATLPHHTTPHHTTPHHTTPHHTTSHHTTPHHTCTGDQRLQRQVWYLVRIRLRHCTYRVHAGIRF